jgi:acylglycerol lipase
MDYSIKLKNGLVLRGLIASPGENIRAVIIFVHGIGEHIYRYSGWYKSLNREGIGFTGVDLPGHGKSDGKRGYIKSFAVMDDMIDILYDSVSNTFPGIPVFLYGQSLGGGVVLDYILRKQKSLRAAIVTSPWLKLSFEPGKAKLLLASVMKNIVPGLILPSGLVTDHLSHAARFSMNHASELRIPLLIMHGSEDMICSPEGSRQFASKTDMAELKIWDGGYHELHNEVFSKNVFTFLRDWIINKL